MRINVFKSGGNSAQGGFVSNGLTLQGPLILSGPHTEPLHAVPKQYVDNAAYNLDANNITSGTLAAARLPAFTGDGTTILGSSNIILAATGVTPGSIVKPTVDSKGRVVSSGSIIESDITGIGFNKFTVDLPTTIDGYGITDAVHVSGNVTVTGQLIQTGNPINPDHAVTKQYVDTSAGLAGGISIGDIIRKPYSTTPSGFLKCNGAEVDKTTYSSLYSVIGDTFANNLTPGCGKPWQLQYAFNKTQTSDVIGWTIGTPLPSVLCHTTAVVTKNRAYVLGGYNGTAYVSTVYTAPINSDGTLGTWVAGTSLPLGLIASSAFVTKNKIYLVGGATTSGTYLNNVYYATINSDGTIGTWVSAPSLPGLLGYTKIIVTKNRVYTLAGSNGSIAISTIYTAVINDDGTLGAWSAFGSLPYSGYLCYTAVIKDRIYVIGGYSSGYKRDVYYANIDNDGVIGSWIPGIFLPKGMSFGECFTTENKLHITFANEVYTAEIYSDGSLGAWYKSATLPYDMGETECIITSSKIYLISAATASYNAYVIYANFTGGSDDYSSYYGETVSTNYVISGSGKPWQQQYQINQTQTTDITGWTTGTSLPSIVSVSNSIVTKNRVYLLSGWNGTAYVSNVYTAPINSDGTLGTWTTGTSLPGILAYSQAIVTKNRAYLLGGATSEYGSVSTVYTAVINADGTLGAWVADISLPAALSASQSIITKNRVYLIGGYNGTAYVSTVYTAPINSDGTIGIWTTDNSLPDAVGYSQAIVTKNRVYLIGGAKNGGVYSSTIYTAAINSDGYIGTWSTGTALPGNRSVSHSIVTKNRVYLLGGYNGTAYVSNVYTAPINSDGTLGAWTTGTSLPGILAYSQIIITNNHVYLLGGHTGTTYLSTVYMASILEGLNDYSPYYDGTNDTPDTTINYMMPGSGKPWSQQYQINTTQSTDITGWSLYGTMPVALSVTSAVVTKNRVYLLGGYGGSTIGCISTIYTAPINADSTLGAWSTAGSLPSNLNTSSAIVTKNRVYLLGGWNGTVALSNVYTAPINADGTLGSWSTVSSLPGAVTGGIALLTRNRVYVLGGSNGTNPVSSVYTAPVGSDGIIGNWSIATSLPIGLYGSQAFITKNRVYICCGTTGSPATYTGSIYTAKINTDGTIGTWTAWGSVPDALYASQVIVTSNRVYLLGGNNGVQDVLNVYSALINSDGTIGNWKLMSALVGGIHWSQVIIVKNKIYLFGAWNSNLSTNQIYSANILSNISDYSPYYDGTIQPVSTVSSKFKLPDYTLLDREFGSYVTSYIKY